jgi:hypothetical protein
MRTIVLTSDKTSWALKAFTRQWDKYTVDDIYPVHNLPFDIYGYGDPGIKGHAFYKIGNFASYPVNRWSDGLIKTLQSIDDSLVMLMLDDYWLTRQVNIAAFFGLRNYMENNPDAQNVIRLDLTTDRLYDKHHDIEGMAWIDLIEAEKDATYNLSFQAAIWRRELLMEVLRPGETPWESEINGSERLNRTPYRVIGTQQWPMRYIVAVNKGKLDLSAKWMVPSRSLSQADQDELIQGGHIPQERLQ